MRINQFTCVFLSITMFLTAGLLADMGSIPYSKDQLLEIYEPRQDAIVAWNGTNQIIYLQTKLRGSKETKVLELMPLPSRPKVTLADPGIFLRAEHLLPVTKQDRSNVASAGSGFFGPGEDAAIVHEQKILGAHNIYIIEMRDPEHFTDWVLKRLRDDGAEADSIPPALHTVVNDYLAAGYKWFIFDVISVYQDVKRKQALQIEFKSEELYYPMRITRTEKGETEVNLSILTTFRFEEKDFQGLPASPFKRLSGIRELTRAQVRFLSEDLWNSMGRPEGAYFRSWQITGKISEFQEDVRIARPK